MSIHATRESALVIAYAHQRLDDLPDGMRVPANRAKPWGTTHAVLAARNEIDGPFTIVNADDYYGPEPQCRRRFSVRQSDVRQSDSAAFAAIAFPLTETLSPTARCPGQSSRRTGRIIS
jgi:hypothetical protein